MRFTGTTILKVENGLITEEVGLDDGVTVLKQLGLIRSRNKSRELAVRAHLGEGIDQKGRQAMSGFNRLDMACSGL
jgi:hypothetical protein